ncbi:MAG: hypothetical protein WBD27_11100 [Pyrinomonadaceae bacterium]
MPRATGELLAQQTTRFIWLGSGLGIGVPLIISFAFHYFRNTQASIRDPIVLLHIGLFLCAFAVPFHIRSRYRKPSNQDLVTDIYFYVAGIVCIFLNFWLVQHTGGFESSIFKFYFFFIPSAVAICYKSGPGVIITGVFSFIFVFVGYIDPPHSASTSESVACFFHPAMDASILEGTFKESSHKVAYILTVFFHFCSIITMELLAKDEQ